MPFDVRDSFNHYDDGLDWAGLNPVRGGAQAFTSSFIAVDVPERIGSFAYSGHALTCCPCGHDHSGQLLAHKLSLVAGTAEAWYTAGPADVQFAPDGSPQQQTFNIPGEVAGDTSTTQTIAVGDSVVSQIEVSGDQDWYRIQLQAGVTYEFRLSANAGSGLDSYLEIMDASGNMLKENDDGGGGLNSLLRFTATSTGTYYLNAHGWMNTSGNTSTGAYTLTTQVAPATPTWTIDQIAAYLANGSNPGLGPRWQISNITYNIEDLSAAEQALAERALAMWAAASSLTFTRTTGTGNIRFVNAVTDDPNHNPADAGQEAAYARTSTSGSSITASTIVITSGWSISSGGQAFDSYQQQTYIHEIGHALGLGHSGPYDGSAEYGTDNLYTNDNWAYTVMSYFDQLESGHGNFRYVLGLQQADIAAIQLLYGVNPAGTHAGNTTYGFNSTAPGTNIDWSQFVLVEGVTYRRPPAMTIYDTGGVDTINLSGFAQPQILDLRPGTFSSLGDRPQQTPHHYVNVVAIAANTIIENAVGGSGNDTITGNTANNTITLGAGADIFVYAPNGGADTVTDFAVAADRLDLTGFSQAAALAAFNGRTASGGGTLLTFGAGQTILLQGVTPGQLQQSNLILSSSPPPPPPPPAGPILGTAGNDVIYGTGGNDGIYGLGGDDTILSLAGDDTVVGNEGDDRLEGGDGNDILLGDAGRDTLLGNAADDILYGGDDDDSLYGNEGDDRVHGDAGNDTVAGDEGNDRLEGGDGNDILLGGSGQDTMLGDSGNDVLYGGADSDSLYGNQGDDRLYGDEGNDTLVGDEGNDRLEGGDGIDLILGGAGLDTILGDAGSDILYGGDNDDYLYGGLGDDTQYGDAGNDTVIGNEGNDRLEGGEGNDLIFGGPGLDTMLGDAGNDILYGGDNDDSLYGNLGNDTLYGDTGNDTVVGDAGDDRLEGGDGNDIILGGAGLDTLLGDAGNDVLYGGEGDDSLYGYIGDDRLHGDAGNDTVVGNEGNDRLEGGDGNDIVLGGAGFDTLLGDAGSDVLYGGDDDDSLYGGLGDDRLHGDGGSDTLVGDEGNDRLEGGDGNDVILGGTGLDTILGDAGSDILYGGDNDDSLYGGLGADNLYGDAGNDTVIGNEDNDRLDGGAGNDLLMGGSGMDMLIGGAGNDILYGEGDADTFVFEEYASGAIDRIADFQRGTDIIQLKNSGFTDFAAVQAAMTTLAGLHTVITFASGAQLRIDNTLPGQLEAGDFHLVTAAEPATGKTEIPEARQVEESEEFSGFDFTGLAYPLNPSSNVMEYATYSLLDDMDRSLMLEANGLSYAFDYLAQLNLLQTAHTDWDAV